MNEIGKTIRNVVIFGIILAVVCFILTILVSKLWGLVILSVMGNTNSVAYVIIALATCVIVYCISMIITKKIFSIKIKLDYKEAKKMLLIILIILLTIVSVKFIIVCIDYYKFYMNLDNNLNAAIESSKKAITSEGYSYMSEEEQETFDELHKSYSEEKESLIKLEKELMRNEIAQALVGAFSYIFGIYIFGLFLYKKESV